MRSVKLKLALLVPIAIAFLGIGSAVRAQTWSWSFTDLGVNYTLSDLTFDQQSTQIYSLVVNTTGYSGPSGAFLDSVSIKAWGGNDVNFVLANAPGANNPANPLSDWGIRTEGPISNGGNTGCGGSSGGFACVEASTKNKFDIAGGDPYVFQLTVTVPDGDEGRFLESALGAKVGAGYANDLGNGQGYGITSVTMVPEPEIYAMLLAGLGLMGFVVNRRR